jgi:hypothetical protein
MLVDISADPYASRDTFIKHGDMILFKFEEFWLPQPGRFKLLYGMTAVPAMSLFNDGYIGRDLLIKPDISFTIFSTLYYEGNQRDWDYQWTLEGCQVTYSKPGIIPSRRVIYHKVQGTYETLDKHHHKCTLDPNRAI